MRRLLCILLITVMLIPLTGCSDPEGTIPFYYLRSEYVYGTEDSVIAPEHREIAGSEDDITYLLRLYLEGPLDSALDSPFPKRTHLIYVELSDGILSLELSKEFAALEGMDLTLASACLASTGFALTDAVEVRITATSIQGVSVILSLTRDSLTLLDDSTTETTIPVAE